MLTQLFMYTFGYFFIKLKSIAAQVIRACIAGAITIFLLISSFVWFVDADSSMHIVGFLILPICVPFLIRTIVDIKNVVRNRK